MFSGFFQVSQVVFNLKMDSLIYFHHRGQFNNPDRETKMPVKMNKQMFIEVSHDVRQ